MRVVHAGEDHRASAGSEWIRQWETVKKEPSKDRPRSLEVKGRCCCCLQNIRQNWWSSALTEGSIIKNILQF